MATKLPPHVIENLRRLKHDSRALLEVLADRLPPEHVEQLRTLSNVGEWTLLVDGLCAELVKGQIPITTAERDALAAVLDLFTTPARDYFRYINDRDGTLAALNLVTS